MSKASGVTFCVFRWERSQENWKITLYLKIAGCRAGLLAATADMREPISWHRKNVRGIYPVYSMTDGVVENIGWLRLGGYRIGIRSPSGAYFYYAHLAEYAKDFQIGETVSAGTFLGFMGDTGYSDVEGTTGEFCSPSSYGNLSE